jgi:prolyl oligopeptidase
MPLSSNIPAYPDAEREQITEESYGHQVADPYRWLEDPSDERTSAWCAAQDELFAGQREGWKGVEPFRARLTELLACGSVSAPVWRGRRCFVMRREPDQDMAVLRVVEPDGTERTLVDPIAIDPAGTTTLDSWQPSWEGDLLAYQLSEGGTEESIVRVMDVATGEIVDGPIDRARYSPIAWLPGGKAYYYTRRLAPDLVPADETQYHRRVWLHRVGGDPKDDVLVFGGDQSKTTYFNPSISRDGRWLTLSASEGTAPRNDLWIADLSESSIDAPHFREVQVGVDAMTHVRVGRAGTAFENRAYIGTDRGAPRGRLCVAEITELGYENWRDLIPAEPDAVLEGYAILDGEELERPLLLVSWTRHAVSEITVHDLATGERTGSVPLPGLGTTGHVFTRIEGGHEAWFAYTDHTVPIRIMHYDGRTGTTSVWAEAPGAVSVPDITTRQVTYTSKDGTPVRMFLMSRADLTSAGDAAPDQPRPTILNGYGGFGISLTPGYSASILAWVEAGGVYAVANLRGGGEEGEEWHRAGMRATKQNVFDDFHAAATWLIEHGWTTSEQLGINGGSNGGLLVGAALTQRPDLYGAVVCSAPLLDMIRYERFGLGATWNDEYGTVADETEFGWLLSYSPYHHVHADRRYPATLFTVFDGDTRVDPLHARKMAAALQHAAVSVGSPDPVLFRRETDVGHGARAVSRSVTLAADTLAFMADRLGLVVR